MNEIIRKLDMQTAMLEELLRSRKPQSSTNTGMVRAMLSQIEAMMAAIPKENKSMETLKEMIGTIKEGIDGN